MCGRNRGTGFVPLGLRLCMEGPGLSDQGRSTPVVTFVNSIANFTTINGTWDNQVTSIFNNGTSGKRIAWYTDINYGGARLNLAKGRGLPRLHLSNPLFNDRISSAKFV